MNKEQTNLFRAKRKDNDEYITGNLIMFDAPIAGDIKAIIIPESIVDSGVTMIPASGSYGSRTGNKLLIGFENWYPVDPQTIDKC